MTTTPLSPAASETVVAALGSFVAIVVSVAAIGAFLAADLLGGDGHDDAPPASGAFRVGQDVPTSFGFVAVEHAETLDGLTPKQLGGAVHGIGSLVSRRDALVQASVTISNTGPGTLRYSPRQFTLVARGGNGKARRIRLAHATVRAGVLQPDAAVDARLSFKVPRDGSRLAVEFADPRLAKPVTILLGNGTGKLTKADERALAQGHTAGASDGQDHEH